MLFAAGVFVPYWVGDFSHRHHFIELNEYVTLLIWFIGVALIITVAAAIFLLTTLVKIIKGYIKTGEL